MGERPPVFEPEKPETKSKKTMSRREVLGLGLGGILAVGVGKLFNPERKLAFGSEGEGGRKREGENDAKNEREAYLNNPEFFVPHENGEFTKLEKAKRLKIYEDEGVEIFEDVGLAFYTVGDETSREEIIENLIAADPNRFDYLEAKADRKIESFNIPNADLKPGMRIPIPVKREYRMIPDEDFYDLAVTAINELKAHDNYGQFIEGVLKKVPLEKLAAAMVAVAHQESGGSEGIGSYELHRYEPAHKTFSYSHFHILMEGPGLWARRKMRLTEGQMYHPKNSCQAFFGFLVEKSYDVLGQKKKEITVDEIVENIVQMLPFDNQSQAENFADFYNGRAWRQKNPGYADNIIGYYDEQN